MTQAPILTSNGARDTFTRTRAFFISIRAIQFPVSFTSMVMPPWYRTGTGTWKCAQSAKQP